MASANCALYCGADIDFVDINPLTGLMCEESLSQKLVIAEKHGCLPKIVVEKMVKEKATWSSFSGSLAKVARDRAGVPSERGTRYFGPSKMSFKNLIVHSMSIIGVFKTNVLIRSVLFLLVYIFLIYQNISIIMIIPIILVFILLVSVFLASKRESLEELNNSLSNISNTEIIK